MPTRHADTVPPCRTLVTPVIAKLIPAARTAIKDEDTADAERPVADDPTDLEEATESTPLINSSAQQGPPGTTRKALVVFTYFSPIFVAAILGLLIGLIKPAQYGIVGAGSNESNGTWAWQSLGSGFVVLGSAFAVIEMVGIGAGVKAGEKKT